MNDKDWMTLIGLGVILAGAAGWVTNIIQIANAGTLLTGMMAVRIAGIFIAPLGAVMGWL